MSAEPHLPSNPPALSPMPDAGLRRRARALAATAGSRLRLAAGRASGDAGLGLLCALLDMIEKDAAPAGWPVARFARLLVELWEIEDRIASIDPDEDVVTWRPAA